MERFSSDSQTATPRAVAPLIRRSVPIGALGVQLSVAIRDGRHISILTARRTLHASGADTVALVAVLVDPRAASIEVWESPLDPGKSTYPSLTLGVPQVHWAERSIRDLFGIVPVGHPRPKSVLLHEAWPEGFYPLRGPAPGLPDENAPRRTYEFLQVKGDGVYEAPVGPIHAGIIEPGHFRFSCLGEVIQNLEIRLGYVHRGVEEAALRVPWRHVRFIVESASSDTTIGNALAHALAIEQILGLAVPQVVVRLRAAALEMERVASHVGDLGGVSGDIGFAAGAAIFGRLRGAALGLLERLTGSRFGTAYILPGRIGRPLTPSLRDSLLRETDSVAVEYRRSEPLLMGNAGAVERMEGTGRVKTSLAKEFGLVGPAGRASGIDYDVRSALQQEPNASMMGDVLTGKRGDVLDRVQIKTQEIRASLAMISRLLEAADTEKAPEPEPLPRELPASQVGVGIVEAWRGELTHAVFTDARGQISRYAIRDPSFNNWTGLSIAVRGELLSDFPLCNKSFGLSYSGNDL